ncbi:hypothetical protein DPQ33_00535 [Oceanidesulfovibrio indonesiensis]|uniref:YkgJ family cysteine cluster protein n=2 Tax=Oceanidesulfovibrio indonesiensis TaxID=54767 RepID=A0A7M3MJL3_9BACT|nr:hypothetical protein DPQ33_00535 [Oceanidesulfovibrio indonesiensis]
MQRTRRIFDRLAALYDQMDAAYDKAAAPLGFTCADCAQNCCISHFQHHTYVEWAYFLEGLEQADPALAKRVVDKARENVEATQAALARGERPRVMCPVNVDGLCSIYRHRLMICRLHGVAHVLHRPDGRFVHYPGCPRFSELAADEPCVPGTDVRGPVIDRTPLYRELAAIEQAFLGSKARTLPKVDMTLAEMIVQGKPF